MIDEVFTLLYQTIDNNTKEISALREQLAILTQALIQANQARDRAPEKGKAGAKGKAAPAKTAPATRAVPAVKYEQVTQAVNYVVSTAGTQAAIDILAEFGASNAQAVAPADWPDLIAKCRDAAPASLI